jgi:hypothetical protein
VYKSKHKRPLCLCAVSVTGLGIRESLGHVYKQVDAWAQARYQSEQEYWHEVSRHEVSRHEVSRHEVTKAIVVPPSFFCPNTLFTSLVTMISLLRYPCRQRVLGLFFFTIA